MEEEQARRLERAMRDLRSAIEVSASRMGYTPHPEPRPTPEPSPRPGPRPQPDPAPFLDATERMVDALSVSEAFTETQQVEFKKLADSALREQLRAVARGGEVALSINITVSGTATISVS